MHLTILSPTVFEVSPLLKYLTENFESDGKLFSKKDLTIKVKVSGVGLVNTAINTTLELHSKKPDIIFLIGVCGSYRRTIPLGEVVNVIQEQFGDLGVEEADGTFTTIHDLDLIEPNEFPFNDTKLSNPSNEFGFLKRVSSISLNTSSGFQDNIDKKIKQFDADIENMEGAAFFQTCLMLGANFLQIRAVSNYVESRNKENWELALAIKNLNDTLIEMIESIV